MRSTRRSTCRPECTASSTSASTRRRRSGAWRTDGLAAVDIGREAQQIIERLAAIERWRPIVDRSRVETALAEHFRRLGLEPMPVCWVEDAAGGYLAAWSAAWSAAESAAWSAAESAAWSAARSAARSAAESAAESAARSAAESAAESAAWSAVYFNTVPKNDAAIKYIEVNEPLLKAVESGLGWFFPMQDQLILVPMPKVLLDTNKRAHSEEGKAVEWRDECGYYYKL